MLSKTEKQLIELRLVGLSRKEIAYKTFRSELTVKTHFQNIHKKLNISEEVQVFIWYLKEVKGIDLKKLIQVAIAICLLIMIEVITNCDALRTRNVKGPARIACRVKAGRSKKAEPIYT